MTYPIFNSFVNQIQSDLEDKNVNIKKFKTWSENRISATGLEILIGVNNTGNFIKEIAINFDWDRFRETALATNLKGLGEHPMLQDGSLKSASVKPKVDVEVNWLFDEKQPAIALADTPGNSRLERAGNWMKQISRQVNELYDDDIITRWHIEIEGNGSGKHLSVISLISYFQYSFAHLSSLAEVHEFINKQLKELLLKTKQVRRISEIAVHNAA